MPKLVYTITQQHIDEGCANDAHSADNCPNYQAAIGGIRRLGWPFARFRGANLFLYAGHPSRPIEPDYRKVRYPDDVYEWIIAYDKGEPVEPIIVTLDIPAPPASDAADAP